MLPDYYAILGVPKNASDAEIKSAFKALAKQHHPDKNRGDKQSEEIFKNVNQAYQTLSDPWKRMSYDFKRDHLNNPSPPISPPPSTANYKKYKPKSTAHAPSFQGYKIYLITGGFFVLFMIGVFFFYNFMNRQAAQEAFTAGLQMERSKQYIEAAEKYSEVLEFDNRYAPAYFRRGKLRIMILQDYRGAKRDFTMAIDYAPKPEGSYYLERAKTFLALHNYKEAVMDLDSLVKINPKSDSGWFYKAQMDFHVRKDYEEARSNYSKVIELKPRSAEAFAGRAFCNFQLENYKNCLKDLNRAIDLSQKIGLWYYYRGICKNVLHKKPAGCEDLQSALRLGFADARLELRKTCQN